MSASGGPDPGGSAPGPRRRTGAGRGTDPRIGRRRLVAVAAVVLVLGGIGLAERLAGPGRTVAADVEAGPAGPAGTDGTDGAADGPDAGSGDPGDGLDTAAIATEATPSGSSGSVWFCPVLGNGVTTTGDRLSLANAGAADATGTVEVVSSSGERRSVPVTVAAGSVTDIAVGEVLDAQRAAAVVELDRGGITAEVTVGGELGLAAAPCSSTAGRTWYLADGRTTRDAVTELALFNPFPEAALVDLGFATDRGTARPTPLQGIAVAPGTVRIVDVGQYVRRRELVATTVVARSGRLAVGQRQVRSGLLGVQGVGVTVAAPAPATTWFVPQLLRADGLTEHVLVLNPNEADTQVDVTVLTAEDVSEPVSVSVGAGRVVALDLDELGAPDGEPFSVAVAAADADGVVVQRTTEAASPARRRGVATMLGSPRAATRWVLAEAGASGRLDTRIIVFNPYDVPAPVSFRALRRTGDTVGPVDRRSRPVPDPVEVPPGGLVEVRLGDTVAWPSLGLEVQSDGPAIVVQRDLIRGSGQDPDVTPVPTIAPPTSTSSPTSSSTPSPTSASTSTPSSASSPTSTSTTSTSTTSTSTSTGGTGPTSTSTGGTGPTSSTTAPAPSSPTPTGNQPLVPRLAKPGVGLSSSLAVIVP